MPATSSAMHGSTGASGAVDYCLTDHSHSELCTDVYEFIKNKAAVVYGKHAIEIPSTPGPARGRGDTAIVELPKYLT